VREVLKQVPAGQWKEFSAFAGPGLEKLTAWDKVVLIGDASHPLSSIQSSLCATLQTRFVNKLKVPLDPELYSPQKMDGFSPELLNIRKHPDALLLMRWLFLMRSDLLIT
jgi:hypothetical protein